VAERHALLLQMAHPFEHQVAHGTGSFSHVNWFSFLDRSCNLAYPSRGRRMTPRLASAFFTAATFLSPWRSPRRATSPRSPAGLGRASGRFGVRDQHPGRGASLAGVRRRRKLLLHGWTVLRQQSPHLQGLGRAHLGPSRGRRWRGRDGCRRLRQRLLLRGQTTSRKSTPMAS
jgi:hypothetical protein